MAFKVNLFLLDLVAIILVVCLQIECVLPQHLPNVMNGNLGRSKILRVGSQLQRSIALHSNASWHTVELTPFEEIGKISWHKKKARCIRSQRCYLRYEELSKNDDKAGYRQMTSTFSISFYIFLYLSVSFHVTTFTQLFIAKITSLRSGA